MRDRAARHYIRTEGEGRVRGAGGGRGGGRVRGTPPCAHSALARSRSPALRRRAPSPADHASIGASSSMMLR